MPLHTSLAAVKGKQVPLKDSLKEKLSQWPREEEPFQIHWPEEVQFMTYI